jgi:hypothetical protein
LADSCPPALGFRSWLVSRALKPAKERNQPRSEHCAGAALGVEGLRNQQGPIGKSNY